MISPSTLERTSTSRKERRLPDSRTLTRNSPRRTTSCFTSSSFFCFRKPKKFVRVAPTVPTAITTTATTPIMNHFFRFFIAIVRLPLRLANEFVRSCNRRKHSPDSSMPVHNLFGHPVTQAESPCPHRNALESHPNSVVHY